MCSEHISQQMGNYLEFHLMSNCLSLLIKNRRYRLVFCRHDGMQNHKTQYPRNAGNTVHCRVLLVHPQDSVADWGLELGCHITRVSYYIYINSLGKDQNSKFEVWFVLNVYCFCIIAKLKNH